MSNRKIRMSLKPSSIDQAIKSLNAEADRIETRTDELVAYLAEFGIAYIHDHAPGIDVRLDRTAHGFSIAASGDLAIAIEFGEGVSDKEIEPETERKRLYVGDPRRYIHRYVGIRGLDAAQRLGGWQGGGGHYEYEIGADRENPEGDEDDDDALDLMHAQMKMVLYNCAMAIRSELPQAARKFFGR